MEIHQLRYFVAVADEGSFSRAAAKVRVAQPSLSQQIRKLEAEVGQPLFDRLPRSVVLTEAGRCLIDYARQILASIGDARRCVDELKSEIEIPKALSRSDPGNRGGRDRRHHSAGGSWRAGCRIGIHLPAKSHSATRISGQRTIACASAERTSSSKKDSGNIGRSQIAKVSTPPRNALSIATGESPARGPSTPAGGRAGRQPAWHDR